MMAAGASILTPITFHSASSTASAEVGLVCYARVDNIPSSNTGTDKAFRHPFN